MNKNILLINFIDLTYKEKVMVLNWRNHTHIKKWMYTNSDISIETHLAFIQGLKEKKENKYFLIKQDEEFLGVIDFTNFNKIENSIYFGLYANPEIKIPGIGRILEKTSIEYAFNILNVAILKLEVFSENKQVRNLHKKFHFIETTQKVINNKDVICMELKNENK